jgi:hypothetical protein
MNPRLCPAHRDFSIVLTVTALVVFAILWLPLNAGAQGSGEKAEADKPVKQSRVLAETNAPQDKKADPAKTADPPKEDAKDSNDVAQTDTSQEKKEEPATKFLRIKRSVGKKPQALQTSIVRYTSTKSAKHQATVDLIGAVHVGEQEYYAELNKKFQEYDVVLYELVAPEGFQVPENGKLESGSGIGMLQNMLKDVLGLEFQLEHVNYAAKNFVHADMSPQEFSKSMKDRGESFLKMFIKMMGQSMAMQAKRPNSSSDIKLMFALIRRDHVTIKQVFAEQFEDMEATMAAFNGKDGSTIITERNKKALATLTKELESGKKKLAIFYGAGHLPDMEQRLIKDFGLKKQHVVWLTAWDLTRAPGR